MPRHIFSETTGTPSIEKSPELAARGTDAPLGAIVVFRCSFEGKGPVRLALAVCYVILWRSRAYDGLRRYPRALVVDR